MNRKLILEKGYFPKELPPPFKTVIYSQKASYIGKRWEALLATERVPKVGETPQQARARFNTNYNVKYASSNCASFSIPKGRYSRRRLEIPNPKQFWDLTILLIENWGHIRSALNISDCSESKPVQSGAIRSVRTKSRTINDFRFILIEKSVGKKYELKFDIAQFYPSIYTHSIPWGIMGKDLAKKYFKFKNTKRSTWATICATNPQAKLYDACDKLDTSVRNCQEKQSIGLPIGPDTSFILAEVIGNRLDEEIKKRTETIENSFVRYYDDYYVYTNSYTDAEKFLKICQQVCSEFKLETNESKITIKERPFAIENDWEINISNFKFKEVNKYELRGFFSLVFNLIEKNPRSSDWIIRYALGRFEYGNILVKSEEWPLFLSLVLTLIAIDQTHINLFLKVLLSYSDYLSKKSKQQIRKILQNLVQEHIGRSHSYETAWILWIFKSLELKCDSSILRQILKSNDGVSKLLCLDLINSNLYEGRRPGLSKLIKSITSADLYNDNWLFVYESFKKGWLDIPASVINNHEYLQILSDFDVEFYNSTDQILTEFEIGYVQPPVVPAPPAAPPASGRGN